MCEKTIIIGDSIQQGFIIMMIPITLTHQMKIYNKLVRTVKKIAPYTVLIDKYISTKDDTYLQEVEWKNKEYISPQYLNLKECKNYHLES